MIVKGKRLKRAILAALADTELQKILDSAMYQSKSVNQIMRDSNVSHSTAYRKIRWLVEEKLLIVDKIEITENGKKSSLFRTILKSFNVKYEYDNVVISLHYQIQSKRLFRIKRFNYPFSASL